MASLCRNLIIQTSRRNILYSSKRFITKELPDPLEHATGLEKREILARQAGNDDPFDMKGIQRKNDSTKDNPNLIPSAFDSRIMGCVCEEDATSISWMWLHKGVPKRCECGHWFKLVHKPPV